MYTFIVCVVNGGLNRGTHAHMGATFFSEVGKNTSKFVVPPKMTLFPFVGEG